MSTLMMIGEAAADTGPCMTRKSHERAVAAMSRYLEFPYTDPNDGVEELRLYLLDCLVDRNRRVACDLTSLPEKPHWLRDAARTYYAELELCDHERLGPLRDAFVLGVKPSAPSPSAALSRNAE